MPTTPLQTLDGYGLPYWLDLPRPRYPVLDQNIHTDAVIIGAGICGLKIANSSCLCAARPPPGECG